MKTSEGQICIYQNGGLPIETVETFIEATDEDTTDAIASSVNSIKNKCQAIDALMESVVADLGCIELEHFDDNGKELTSVLKNRFQKIQSDFYWKVFERESEASDDNSWMANSYIYMLSLLENDGHQCLVVPELRKTYKAIADGDNLSKDEKEQEFQEWLEYIRKDFGLSEDWK